MPPLATMLRTQSLPGFEGVETNKPNAPPAIEGEGYGLNPYLRCPLPPFSTTIDTIRQWNMTGKLPVMRVIPLPTQQGAGGGATTNIVNVTATPGGSGGTSPVVPPTTLTPLTVFLNIPSLAPGGTYKAILKMSESFQPLLVSATVPIEVRLYSNATTQTIDIARQTDASPTFANIEGMIGDVILDTNPNQWAWENRIGAKEDNQQTTNVYVTIVNPSLTTGTNAGRVTIVYQPLES